MPNQNLRSVSAALLPGMEAPSVSFSRSNSKARTYHPGDASTRRLNSAVTRLVRDGQVECEPLSFGVVGWMAFMDLFPKD